MTNDNPLKTRVIKRILFIENTHETILLNNLLDSVIYYNSIANYEITRNEFDNDSSSSIQILKIIILLKIDSRILK